MKKTFVQSGHLLTNLMGTLDKASKVLNLAAEFDSDLKGIASDFESFTSTLNTVRDFVMGLQKVSGQKNIEVNKKLDLVIIKDNDGNVKNLYKKENMKTDFQKLAALQESKSSEAVDFATTVKDRYKDYFDTVKGDNTGVTLIGLRGWGIGGTKKRPTLYEKARKVGEHDYDDMLLVLDPEGNLGAFDQVNFEGTSARNRKKKGKSFPYPAITDGSYDLVAWTHDGASEDYSDVLLTKKNGLDTYLPTKEWNQYTENFTAYGIEIHKGGKGWTYSEGCITIFAPSGSSTWDRFMSSFPSDAKDLTKVGTFDLMNL